MKKLLLATLLLITAATQAQDTLKYSKRQVADDIRFFLKNAADIHPNLYHDISPQNLTKRTDSLINQLPDSLSVLMACRALSEATAFVNEGHTSINTPRQIQLALREGNFKAIPMQVSNYADNSFDAKLVLADGSVKVAKVTAINGVPANKVFTQMIALKGGLTSYRKVVVTGNFRYYLALIGMRQPYKIEYAEQGQPKQTITLNGISTAEYNATIGKPANNAPYTFSIVNSTYGYLNFRSMVNFDNFTKFCDSVFEVLDKQHIGKLVIDLRENSGGNSALARPLINYLTNTPYRMAGESERKVSQQFREYITRNRDVYGAEYDGYLKLKDGEFFKLGLNSLTVPGNMPHKFKGKACFLIGPYTFSSANMTAATLKDYKLCTLIGKPTGEPGNDYGELCNINLPNTGLSGFTSTTLWVRPNNNKTDHNPIMPDYNAKQTSASGDDVLAYAVKWLEK